MMPDRPLLILPTHSGVIQRSRRFGGGDHFHRPGRRRQAERLTPRFEQLERALEARRARLQTEAQGLVPEEVIVFETIGSVNDFLRAVNGVAGMEWLGEIEEEEIPPDDDFFAVDKDDERRADKSLRGRLFMVFSNQQALHQMLSLWEAWQNGEKLPRGLGPWRPLFEQLRDVRTWGVQDRLIETGILEDWQDRVDHGQEVVPCEIELWFRQSLEQRLRGRERVAALISRLNGRIISEVVIEEIAYHGLLAQLPIGGMGELVRLAQPETELVQCEQIQFFRASGQMTTVIPGDERYDEAVSGELAPPEGSPVVALLDGLPLQAHRRLEGRLVVDDPDDFESQYPAGERRHGTAMASLIIHGDLAAAEPALRRPLYVRPILKPDPRDWQQPRHETVSEDSLVVDLLHRAVRRLFEGDGNQPPVAPGVCVINLSIGIRDRLFDGSLSPLARLLDWLAWRYQVLFVVSAGNHPRQIELSVPTGSLASLTPEELQNHILKAIAADARHRRLLSPAEGVNALTVGALCDDRSDGSLPPRWTHSYVTSGLPSPINAQGMGYRRGIKPDVMVAGGRVPVQESIGSTTNLTLDVYNRLLSPGQTVAAPGGTPGDRNAVWFTRGTSNAAALISRAGGLLHDVLDELRTDPGGGVIDVVPRSIWLKALLGHGADWGPAGSVLDELLRTADNNRQLKEYLTRLLGFGAVNIERVRECTSYRATAISGGVLAKDQAHVHRYPLPPSLSGRRGHRRLIVTLAWLTPVNPRHQSWRRADLWFAPPKDPLRVERQQADWRATQRGTLQHEILEGDQAGVFVDGDQLEIQVSCRADAGDLEETVPYALVTTLEVAEEIGIPIYDEIQVRVRQRIPVVPPGS